MTSPSRTLGLLATILGCAANPAPSKLDATPSTQPRSADAGAGADAASSTREAGDAGEPEAASSSPGSGTLVVYAESGARLVAFTVNRLTGALTSNGPPIDTCRNPINLAVGPGQKFLFAACDNYNGVAVLAIDPRTGALKAAGMATADPGSGSVQLGVHRSGRFLATAGYSTKATLFGIAADGTATKLQTVTIGPKETHAATFDGLGKFLYVNSAAGNEIDQFSFDETRTPPLLPLTPATLAVVDGETAGKKEPRTSTATSDGKLLYVMGQRPASVFVFKIDPAKGTLSKSGSGQSALTVPFSDSWAGKDIVLHPEGKHAYASVYGAEKIGVFDVGDGGELTLTSSVDARLMGAGQLAIDPAGQFLFLAGQSSNTIATFRIDAGSGALTPVGTPESLGKGDSQAIAAVNLPGT